MRYQEIINEIRAKPAAIPRPVRTDGTPYPDVLSNAREIARFIVSVASEYDEEAVENEFEDCEAVLRLMPVGNLHEGDGDHHHRDVAKERRYAKMDPITMPPLVIENGEITDGNHRFRVGVARGQMAFWCYAVMRDSDSG